MSNAYSHQIRPEEDLPEDYAFVFYKLRFHLSQLVQGPIGVLQQSFNASVPVRPYWERQPPPNSTTSIINMHSRIDKQQDASLNNLMFWMIKLFDERQRFLAGLNSIMDELGRIAELDPNGKGYITSFVANQISELSILSQCTHKIKLYLPWSATFEAREARHKEALQRTISKLKRSSSLTSNVTTVAPSLHLETPPVVASNIPSTKTGAGFMLRKCAPRKKSWMRSGLISIVNCQARTHFLNVSASFLRVEDCNEPWSGPSLQNLYPLSPIFCSSQCQNCICSSKRALGSTYQHQRPKQRLAV